MKEMINIADLLRDCPKGMKLDCTMWEDVTFDSVLESSTYPIRVMTPDGLEKLTEYGSYSHNKRSKCVIFPEGKDTWERFIPPYKFKDGDVLAVGDYVFIFKKLHANGFPKCHCHYDLTLEEFKVDTNSYMACGGDIYFATKEQQDLLFSKMKDAGYIWNTGTKTLEKLKLKFKVSDIVKNKKYPKADELFISGIREDHYIADPVNDYISHYIKFKEQDNFELVSKLKFDIKTLKPFSKVLVRNANGPWQGQFYMKYDSEIKDFPFKCMSNHWAQCIPFKGNEHLLDSKKDCDEYYKTWEE